MADPKQERIKELFQSMVRRAPSERSAWLEAQCADDLALKSAVESLLAAHEGANSFLQRPPTLPDDTPGSPPPASLGPHSSEDIDRYRLVTRVDEGGMGEVWLAEQQEPVRRRVAVKVIKAGMDTAQVIARFEAERQALALMDHPAIARVFDAGATLRGRPYFVMEYVPGLWIT